MLGAYATYSLYSAWGVSPLASLAVTVPGAYLLGLALHRLLYARVLSAEGGAGALESRSLILSFGLLFVLQNVALLIWSADLRGYGYLSSPVRALGTAFPLNRMVGAGIALALSLGFYAWLRTTLQGKAVRALMQEPDGARLVGIEVARVHARCFGAGLAMSAATGSLVSMLFELTPFMGLPYTVTALVVIILGGLGNVLGSVVGALLLGLVETASVYLTASDIRPIVSYGVLSLILVWRPAGILGRR
jgi:branched-chain amino acid transport system permease protein